MLAKTRNILILLATFLTLMAIDLYFLLHDGTQNTFSAAIFSFSKDWPIVTFFFGAITGHLLWPLAKDTMGKKENISFKAYPHNFVDIEEKKKLEKVYKFKSAKNLLAKPYIKKQLEKHPDCELAQLIDTKSTTVMIHNLDNSFFKVLGEVIPAQDLGLPNWDKKN